MCLLILMQVPIGAAYPNAGTADTSHLQALSVVLIQASLYGYGIAMITVGVWLIVKGFGTPSAPSEPTSSTSITAPTPASTAP